MSVIRESTKIIIFFPILWLNAITTIMSGRILSHRLVPLLRNGHLARHLHNAGSRTGGLLRADGGAALRGRAWPIGSNGIHNVPAVRSISFARMLPKLAMKLIRVPAMFGGATIAGLAYFQYQATRTFPALGLTSLHEKILLICFYRGRKLCTGYF
jgi:hypothetical protein